MADIFLQRAFWFSRQKRVLIAPDGDIKNENRYEPFVLNNLKVIASPPTTTSSRLENKIKSKFTDLKRQLCSSVMYLAFGWGPSNQFHPSRDFTNVFACVCGSNSATFRKEIARVFLRLYSTFSTLSTLRCDSGSWNTQMFKSPKLKKISLFY